MMESYNGIGIQNINVADLASGVASFFVVAIGGTIIGKGAYCKLSRFDFVTVYGFRCNLGIFDWPGHKVHRPCTSYRAYLHFRDGIFSLLERGNFPYEWDFGVSMTSFSFVVFK